MILRTIIEKLAKRAGITIDGPEPHDITVNNSKFFRRIVFGGSIGLGDSYIDGLWDSKKIDVLSYKLLKNHINNGFLNNIHTFFMYMIHKFFNFQSIRRAFIVGEQHYDIGNDLYDAMLDSRLAYTCGYWKDAKNLEEAQEHKLRLTCEKLGLKPGMKVLDIGCGWGSFAIFAAKEYKVSVVGITVSKEQIELAKKRAVGLPVEFLLLDYRNLPNKYGKEFDKVVSLGMFEHVGQKNYNKYFSVVDKIMKNDGLFLLHTIGTNDRFSAPDPWIDKHIFPNGVLPTLLEIVNSVQGHFIMEDWHNFGTDYDKTLMAWYDNIEKAWDTLPTKYDEKFKRMWRYYLLICAGVFRSRRAQLWQIVFSRGVIGGYKSIR